MIIILLTKVYRHASEVSKLTLRFDNYSKRVLYFFEIYLINNLRLFVYQLLDIKKMWYPTWHIIL